MQTAVVPICRICLETLNEYIDMKLLYSEDKQSDSKKFTYMDCLRECTHLDLDINVPQGICIPCSSDLRFAYEFLKKAKSAAQFYKEYAQKFSNELLIVPKVIEPPSSPVTIGETEIKIEEVLESQMEKVELVDPLSETKEIPIVKIQSEEGTVDILESINFLKSDEENDQFVSVSDWSLDTLESIAIDKEKSNNSDQLKEHANGQELEICTISRESTYKNTENTKGSRKTNTCHIRSIKNSKKSSRICKICRNNLDDLNLAEHMEKYHMHIEKCQHCEYEDKEFKVRKHEKIKHANIDKYLCDKCSKTYFTQSSFNAHLRFHQRKRKQSEACKICEKTFSDQRYLRKHLETHKKERKIYKCEQCDKLYYTKVALDYHIKMHTGETFKCLECDKQFSRQSEFKVHMSFHTRIFPHKCEICGKMFAIKGHLRSHMWKHQGLKLQCEECPKLFTSTSALLQHSYTHLAPEEMPFQCCYCSKAYPSTNKYRVHLKSAHSIELNEEELQKLKGSIVKNPLKRKKLKLVEADSV